MPTDNKSAKADQASTDLAKANAELAKALAEGSDQPLVLPDIHFLQAQRQALQMNRDELDPPTNRVRNAQIALLDAQIAVIDQKLEEGKGLTNPPSIKIQKDT